MPSFDLTPLETRVLGCLLEKERLTPENYPLSLNSLTAACNQTTNRQPVASYDEKSVEAGVDAMRQKKLATAVFGAGSRVQKYRHNLLDHFELDRKETALLAVLLLRGPQTLGELRGRTERMHHFESLEEVESCLRGLAEDESPLVRVLPADFGQKEKRYVQLISGEPEIVINKINDSGTARDEPRNQSRVEAMEGEIAELKGELRQLREEFALFRKQFE